MIVFVYIHNSIVCKNIYVIYIFSCICSIYFDHFLARPIDIAPPFLCTR